MIRVDNSSDSASNTDAHLAQHQDQSSRSSAEMASEREFERQLQPQHRLKRKYEEASGSSSEEDEGEREDELRRRSCVQQHQQLQRQLSHHNHLQQQRQQQQQQQQQSQQQTNSDTSNRPKRNPFCSRCRNHGKSAQVKGHKRHCEYRDCQCEGCKLVECRQIVSAAQIKRRRYQKQDEECGRQIEISPPVLKREPNSDPAALIAKTLIGSSKHLGHGQQQHHQQQQPPPHQSHHHMATHAAVGKHLSLIGAGHHNQHAHLSAQRQLADLPMSLNPAAAAVSLAAAAAAASSVSSASSVLSNPFMGHMHSHQLLAGGGLTCSNGSPGGSVNHMSGQAPTTNHHSTSISPQSHHLQQHRAPDMSSPNPLNNALHLFQFPGSMFSAAAAASLAANMSGAPPVPLEPGKTVLPTGGSLARQLVASTSNSNASNSPALPSSRDQINLVEEIDQTFGPLAIYAWFRAEHFNAKKIRDLIEVARVPFDELLQATGHSPLDLTSPIVDI